MLEISIIPALTDNYIYLLHEPDSGLTAVVDPAAAAPVMAASQRCGFGLNYIFNTHHHSDHIGANLELKAATGCKIVGAKADRSRIPGIDIALGDGDRIALGAEELVAMDTPGHTVGHIVYYSAGSSALFCGDTLFSLGCGRLFEGSAEQMWHSLQKLKTLPAETKVYCAHEYTEANARFALTLEPGNPLLQQRYADVCQRRRSNAPTLPSTIGQELATNPFFREHSPEIRQNLALAEASPLAVFTAIRKLKDGFR
ncbi:hydroxyacylglutathione hydrolase [Methylomonas koyamae]|uniref:Hydroxyacylglutathione hydrolase n=1 Tax=Methylomonas koyamae TaxID=702114 RepID=A0A291IH55_9GAMM|nr:hydroxyacylglutathione hydrolase [Methylomonas koyamae]ATG89500.1 hydroxyacylglutathione hydrolase [Methylomonas koyamae]OAI22812.1 hydroxyacylglutathione hydrolase [Methylomonas koyamae]